ncbi:unnamed protein product [Cutaneotrichosporon oleaginosum]
MNHELHTARFAGSEDPVPPSRGQRLKARDTCRVLALGNCPGCGNGGGLCAEPGVALEQHGMSWDRRLRPAIQHAQAECGDAQRIVAGGQTLPDAASTRLRRGSAASILRPLFNSIYTHLPTSLTHLLRQVRQNFASSARSVYHAPMERNER